MQIVPTVIHKVHNKEYFYDIYSRLLEDRIIMICGEITQELASSVIAQLLYLESQSPSDDIYMYIHSPGGEVSSGLAIYDTMNFIQPDISTISIGMSASMGAFLLSSGTKGKRYALENSEIMIHQPMGGSQGQVTDIEIATKHIMKEKEKLNCILAKNTNQTIQKIKKDTERDHYLSAQEALNYGLIDEILTHEKML